MFDDKVMCAGHAGAWSVVNGSPEHAPAIEGIQSFNVLESAGKSYVQIPVDELRKPSAMKLARLDPKNKRNFVILGNDDSAF